MRVFILKERCKKVAKPKYYVLCLTKNDNYGEKVTKINGEIKGKVIFKKAYLYLIWSSHLFWCKCFFSPGTERAALTW